MSVEGSFISMLGFFLRLDLALFKTMEDFL